jgi:tRNA (mo5U34)-methyltransferase
MATRSISILGLRAAMFASRKRLGVELSLPVPGRRRPAVPATATPAPAMLGNGLSHDAVAVALAARVSEISWYHTLDLRHGIVTPGFYDHRPILEKYRLPDRLDGLRVLDIATARELDLSFRVYRRMLDQQLNRSFGDGFRLAHEALCSRVRHEHCNVYDLTPDRLGLFDLVHCGDLLLHLRDPALALSRIRSVTQGYAMISDCIFPDLDRDTDQLLMCYEGGRNENVWWRFSASALKRMIADAGFDTVDELSRFRYGPRGAPKTLWHAVYRAVP